jgi:dTDP-glucose pyrophosphorylase
MDINQLILSSNTGNVISGQSDKVITRINKDGKSYILIDFTNCKGTDEVFDNNKLSQYANYIINHNILKNHIKIPKLLGKVNNKILLEDLGDIKLKTIYDSISDDKILNYYNSLLGYINIIQKVMIHDKEFISNRLYGETSIICEINKFLNLINVNVEDIYDEVEDLANQISDMPKTIIHRDFQSDNIIIKDDQLYLINYQDLSYGCFLHDLVSLLYDLNVNISNDIRTILLKSYWDKTIINQYFDFRDFVFIVNINALHRVMKSLTWRINKYKNMDFTYHDQIINGYNYLIEIKDIVTNDTTRYDNIFDAIHGYFPSSIITVILAAGKGSRLLKHTNNDIPKTLHKLSNKPMIDYIIEQAYSANPDHILMVVGYKKELIKNYTSNLNIKYVDQDELLGTGHAVSIIKPLLKGFHGNILILMGDAPRISTTDIDNLLYYHKKNKYSATILTKSTINPRQYGRVIRNEFNNLHSILQHDEIEYEDKDDYIEVVTGTIIFKANILYKYNLLTCDNKHNEYYLPQLLDILIKKGYSVGIYKSFSIPDIHSINTLEELQEAELNLL